MERRTMRLWVLFLNGVLMLALGPRLSETERHNTSGEKETHTDTQDTVPVNVTQLPGENHTWIDHNRREGDGYLADPAYATPPLPATTPQSPCKDVEEVLRAGEGGIEMTETQQDCNDVWTWDIRASSPGDGIILQFNDVFLRGDCTLRVFTLARGSERQEQRKFTHKKYESKMFHPLLLKEARILVVLDAPYDNYKYGLSRVNISYFACPIAQMPQITYPGDVPSSSISMYDCSGNATIPAAFRCNMVQQCISNEDEEGCEYTKQGCEKGWVPYKDQCLKMEFVTVFSYIPGHAHPTHPDAAERRCTKYGASLGKLPDDEGLSLVSTLLRQSGHWDVVVGIHKVKPVAKSLRHLYRYLWQWGNKGSAIAYDQQQLQRDGMLQDCATLNAYPGFYLQPLRCVLPDRFPDGYVCMKPNPTSPPIRGSRHLSVHFPAPSHPLTQIPTKRCSDGSLVQTFHHCQSGATIQGSPNGFTEFQCRYGPPVHYALVCDGNSDCADGSDEMDCDEGIDSQMMDAIFICENFQKIAKSQQCNGVIDCFDESDEVDCTTCKSSKLSQIMCTGVGCVPAIYAEYIDSCPSIALSSEGEFKLHHPSVVTLNGYGMSRMVSATDKDKVKGMFQCNNGDFIPSFLLSNGELDCRFGEDENIPLKNVKCPGFYRCQYSGQCVHPMFICDRIYHCPYKDDERYCKLPCPADCVCEGYAYSCTNLSEPQKLSLARYLDLSGNMNVSLHPLQFMISVQFLNLSYCGLGTVHLRNMSQLRIVDLSFNNLTSLTSLAFEQLTGLRTLNLSGNPFVKTLDSSFPTFVKSSGLVSLNHLIVTDTNLQSIEDKALSLLIEITTLNIQRNQIKSYGKDIFFGMENLKLVLTDDSKLCCSYFHTALTECVAPVDELSSCKDLLREDFFRVFLWTLSVLAIAGNAGVLLYRAFAKQQGSPPAFRVLVSNLCTADFLMGIYMMMIGIADAQFRGIYVTKESEWKSSLACKIAGVFGIISSEVSALVICLITLDRLLVLSFPLKNHLHLKGRSSMTLCIVVWFFAVCIATVPFLLDMDFYGETSICLPLPITRQQYSGQAYAFGVFIIFNFILFIFIGVGQIFIFITIRKASHQAGARRRSQELAIARRLFLVVFTDFCCWFPIGLMGLLASQGVPISGEVNVWAAIFILPLNSALNPFLYTLNAVLEKRRASQLQQRAKKILANMQSQLPKMDPRLAEEVVRVCIRSKVVKKEKMLAWLNLRQDSNITVCESSDIDSDRNASFIIRDSKSSFKSSAINE